MNAPPPEDLRVLESRHRVERRLEEIRLGLQEDFGILPRTTAWVVPAIGAAIGLTFAVRAFGRRRRLR